MTELAILMIKTVVTTIDVMFGAVLICGKGVLGVYAGQYCCHLDLGNGFRCVSEVE